MWYKLQSKTGLLNRLELCSIKMNVSLYCQANEAIIYKSNISKFTQMLNNTG